VSTAMAEETQEWAGYRGPAVDGVASDPRAFSDFGQLGLKATWKTKIGSGYSGLAIASGKVITQYADGESDVMAAFDAVDGRKLWSYPFSETYTGHDGSHDGPVATPLIADGRVFGLGPRGEFFAVDLETGKEIWSTHLAKDHEIRKPHYGYGTSPILEDGMLILELGGEGSAIAGFDPATGEKKWSAASDAIGYQVPVPMTLGGKRLILGAGETKLFGVDAKSGEVFWEWAHGGGGGRGAHSMTPVPVGKDKIFLAHQDNASKVITLGESEPNGESETPGIAFDALWETRSIRNSYNVPVVHDGHVYAFSSRFLTCVDAATGEAKWRSREPGDGFLIVAGGRLVIVTKNGGLHIAEASPEGYNEIAALPIFEDQSWTAPSFAGGSIYARSFGELARLDFTAGTLETHIEIASRGVQDSTFGKFLARVEAAADSEKAGIVDAFLDEQKSFPIVEGDRLVHFVYRGASDVAVAGDPFGARQEQPMTQVPGTDLFYHSVELEPDSRISYLFIKDYEEEVDPRNPRRTTT
ncbi:MAG: PQQ-binding-like beta-propeller repeat protein, partial [Acidobacteriota bacterium]